MKKNCLFFAYFFVLSSLAQGAYIANRDFLSVGQGARANGMGEAYVAVADDPSAVFWNPAGLTQLISDQFTASYANRYNGLANETVLDYSWRGPKNMWAVSYMGSYIQDISLTPALTDQQQQNILNGTFAPDNYPQKGLYDHGLLVAYARPLSADSPHSLGATVKIIYRDMLGMVKGYGSAIDIGYHYLSESGQFRYGANLQNAASLVTYTGTLDNIGSRATATESYLMNIKTGFAYQPSWRLLNGRMLWAFDVDMLTTFDVEDYRAGIEYSFSENISLRGGKIFRRISDSSEDYSLGMGVKFKNFILDFSFLTSELGDTSRGTIGYKLGGDYSTPSRYK